MIEVALPARESFSIEADDVFRAVFYGLRSDGAVGANKESIKIIGEHTPFTRKLILFMTRKKQAA
jgi:pyruvate-ferredoxin/flavodoxin oxidoreductase